MNIMFLMPALFLSFGLSVNDARAQTSEVLLQHEGEVLAQIGKLRGTLQVQADSSTVNPEAKTAYLKGNVVITAKSNEGRVMTLRAKEATIPIANAEFQVTNKLFDPEMGWLDQLQFFGQQAGVREQALALGIKKHAGFNAYRLRASGVAAGAARSDIIVYDVSKQTLKLHGIFNYPEAGIIDIEDVTFYDVTTEKLQLATPSQQINGVFTGADIYRLKEFGCRMVDKSRRIRQKTKR